MLFPSDFKKDDGTVDWVAYHNACIEQGEKCYLCEESILFPTGTKTLCHNCEEAEENPSVLLHPVFIRCPYCGHLQKPDSARTYEAGEHGAECEKCHRKYEFITIIEFRFESPEMEEEEGVESD